MSFSTDAPNPANNEGGIINSVNTQIVNEDQIHSTLPIMRRRIINSVAWEKLLALLRPHPILSFVQKLNLVEKLYEAIKMSAKFFKADS